MAPETVAPETIGTFGTKALGFASWTISLAFCTTAPWRRQVGAGSTGRGWEHERRYARHRAV